MNTNLVHHIVDKHNESRVEKRDYELQPGRTYKPNNCGMNTASIKITFVSVSHEIIDIEWTQLDDTDIIQVCSPQTSAFTKDTNNVI